MIIIKIKRIRNEKIIRMIIIKRIFRKISLRKRNREIEINWEIKRDR